MKFLYWVDRPEIWDLKFGVPYTEDKKNDILSWHINMIKKILIYGISVSGILSAIALLVSIKLPLIQSFRIVFGLIFVFFLPGFIWSFVLFMKKSLDIIERATISIVLSISLVSLVTFFSNKSEIRITALNSSLEIVSIVFLAVIIIAAQKLNIAKKLYEKN